MAIAEGEAQENFSAKLDMGVGFMFRSDWMPGHPHFSFFELAIHHHFDSEDTEWCPFRSGLDLGILGFHMAVGIFSA